MSGTVAVASEWELPPQPAIDLVVDIHVISHAEWAFAWNNPSLPLVNLAVDVHVDPPTIGADGAQERPPMPRPRPLIRKLTSVRSPAEQLGLRAGTRDKAEECLARAIYFEARGESVRGQVGIAQVIMNRVFSRYYPDKVCGVVYQNAHRRNACQFSFACDRRSDVVKNHAAWALALHIAKLTLDGRIWDTEIGKATHYHAVWVRPRWVGTMTKLAAHGVHIFYRPVRWGDGSDEPDWSRVAAPTVVAALN